MLYIIFFLVISLIISVIKHKNSFTWIFVTMIAIISMMLVATIFVYVKLSNFSAVFSWEQSIYLVLSKIKINYYSIFDIFILSIAAYMLTSVVFVFRVVQVRSLKRFLVCISAMMLPLAAFLLLNLYESCIRIFFALQRPHGVMIDMLAENMNLFNLIILAVYAILPFAAIGWSVYHTQIRYRRKNLAIISIYLLTVDVIMGIVLFSFAPYQAVLFYAPDFLRMPGNIRLDMNENAVIILLVCVLFFVAFSVFAVITKLFDNVDFNTRYIQTHPQKIKVSFQDTRGVFHTCKNMLLSIDFLAKGIEQKSPPPEIQASIQEMHSLIGDSLGRLTHLLNIYNDPMEVVDYVDLNDCITDAVQKTGCPPEVEVSFHKCPEEVFVYVDNILLEEAFVNLLKNACEAISQKQPENGKIQIRIFTEGDWACVYIRDNGCGIQKKNYHKVFKPLFSTKKTAKNWGVGLSFVSNVMTSLGGKVSVQSELGEYTEFELLFPLCKIPNKQKQKIRGFQLFKSKAK